MRVALPSLRNGGAGPERWGAATRHGATVELAHSPSHRNTPPVIVLLLAQMLLAPPPVDAMLPPFETIDHTRLGVLTPIENPPGQDAMRAFYQSLVRTSKREDDPTTKTREDQTRIVVYGASHVAGDMFTQPIRNELKSRYGDAGLGFLVPASPWRDYYNRDANISYSPSGWDSFWVSRKNSRDDGRYGLAGISFSSNSRNAWAKISTSKTGPYGKEVDHIEVWYWRSDKGGDFVVDIDNRMSKRVKTKPNRKKNETEGLAVWSIDLKLGRHEVELKPVGNGTVTFFGVVMDRSNGGIVMDSMGINGARATDHLDWDAGLFTAQLQRRDPDLVVLAYGTNDIGDDEPPEEYARKLDIVINRVRSAAPQASCLFVGPSDRPIKVEVSEDEFSQAMLAAGVTADRLPPLKRGKKRLLFQRRPRQQAIIDVQRKVAWRYGCGYWNWVHAMGGDLSILSWTHADEPYGSPDYVHLTKLGYERIASLFWDAMMGPFEGGRRPLTLAPVQGPSFEPVEP